MLASNRIEALAFAGKCRWQMFWTGYTSAYTIPVPRGGFVLLRQIIYTPFLQGKTLQTQIANSVHQISLVEQGSRNELLYIFRDPLSQIVVSGAAVNTPASAPQIVETWATYKNNVCVDIANAPDPNSITYAAAATLSSEAQERVSPLGYGGVNIKPLVNITAAQTYYPSGEQRQFDGVVYAGAGIQDRLRYNNNITSAIQDVQVADANAVCQFPIIGFGCWVFNIPINEYLNSGN